MEAIRAETVKFVPASDSVESVMDLEEINIFGDEFLGREQGEGPGRLEGFLGD